jgi:hypothetical protein
MSTPGEAERPTQPDDASVPDRTPSDPEPTGEPVDPAIATSTPDPGQTGRDQR